MIRQRVQAAAVVLFALVIAGVVVVLLMRLDRDAPAGQSASSDSGDDLESATGDPVGRVSLTAGKGDLVLRVKAGSCTEAGGPKLEVSENQGRSFRQVLVPQIDDGSGVSASSPKVRAIVFADATAPLSMTVGAADAKCVVNRYSTTDRGVTWNKEPGEVKEWYVDPSTGVVVSPRGPTDVECGGVASLAPVSKSAAKVFCDDGTIRSTQDRGTTWTDVGTLAKTSAAVFTNVRTGYALVAGSRCKSRVNTTIDGGVTWTPMGCVAEEFIIPGLTDTGGLLVAGGSGGVRLSTDGGKEWKPPTTE